MARLQKNKKLKDKRKSIETKEKISIRLRKNYDNIKKKKILIKTSHLLPPTDYSEDFKIEKITDEVKNNILNSLREKLGAQYLDEGVCVVCDRYM